MRNPFKSIRLRQLSRDLRYFDEGKRVPTPKRGWLRGIRESLGLSLDEVGKRMKLSKQHVKYFEHSEAIATISLKNLKRVANALDCQVVYAVVPKDGSLEELAAKEQEATRSRKERKVRDQVEQAVATVEHTMSLEDQAAGNVEQLIEDETKRRLRK
jgi:predicted DNA-binding mobile mystery protein A